MQAYPPVLLLARGELGKEAGRQGLVAAPSSTLALSEPITTCCLSCPPSAGFAPGSPALPDCERRSALPGTTCRCAVPVSTTSGVQRTCTLPPGSAATPAGLWEQHRGGSTRQATIQALESSGLAQSQNLQHVACKDEPGIGPWLGPPSTPQKAGQRCPVLANLVPLRVEPLTFLGQSRDQVAWGASPCGPASGSCTSTPAEQQSQKMSREMGAGSPKSLASKHLPQPPHFLPPPTSRDLADPVKLCLALHGHPLQGGQVQHCTAADVIIIMTAPVKIVVGKLESKIKKKEGCITGKQEARPEPRPASRVSIQSVTRLLVTNPHWQNPFPCQALPCSSGCPPTTKPYPPPQPASSRAPHP